MKNTVRNYIWWGLALAGQFLFVFSLVCLSGPGRIDIDDGQIRYEEARSLVDHGDLVIRGEDREIGVFVGRDGQQYSVARWPQVCAGIVAIRIADVAGPVSEGRRHFFFVLTSAFASAVLSTIYTALFAFLSLDAKAAFLWGTLGVFCTPNWFYGTSTFDDIIGAVAVVFSVAVAFLSRHGRSSLGAALAGLGMCLAWNCKQPLGAFVLPVLVANYNPHIRWRGRILRVGLVLAGLILGMVLFDLVDRYKFPPAEAAARSEFIQNNYIPLWGNPLAGFFSLTLSPGTGTFWYSPTLLLSLFGFAHWLRTEKWFCWSLAIAAAVFVGFISCITMFSGDWAWGPRYLTPLLALMWLFVPAGAATLRPGVVKRLVLFGFLVQACALSVDHYRLYIERRLPVAFYVQYPWIYFELRYSHLVNRPREMVEILVSPSRSEVFSPARSPTHFFKQPDFAVIGPEALRKYHVLNSFRPWWLSQQFLPPEDRPVDLWRTFGLLASGAAVGIVLLLISCRKLRPALSRGLS